MSDVHYFPRYAQQENFVTNNTLLLLARLREHSRSKFEKFVELLCASNDVQSNISWLSFQQQQSTEASVLDGFIGQDSVKIAVETKRTDAFDAGQLINHLTVFGDERNKLLILLSPSAGLGLGAEPQFAEFRKRAKARNVLIVRISFEDIVKATRECLSPWDEEMAALVSDYEAFCSEMELLPRDKSTLFVPPCGLSYQDNRDLRLYYCPAAWNRRQARYLGLYKEKKVGAIGRVVKVVACDVDLGLKTVRLVPPVGEVALNADEERRIIEAARNGPTHGWNLSNGHKFYLCDAMEDTSFRKISPGGIMGHRYFDLAKVLGGQPPGNLAELATKLRSVTWE